MFTLVRLAARVRAPRAPQDTAPWTASRAAFVRAASERSGRDMEDARLVLRYARPSSLARPRADKPTEESNALDSSD